MFWAQFVIKNCFGLSCVIANDTELDKDFILSHRTLPTTSPACESL